MGLIPCLFEGEFRGEAWAHLGLNNLITNVLKMTECSLVCSLEESCMWGMITVQAHLPNKYPHPSKYIYEHYHCNAVKSDKTSLHLQQPSLCHSTLVPRQKQQSLAYM